MDHSIARQQPGSFLPQTRLQQRFLAVRGQSEALCAPLAIEDYVIQSMPDVSPPKWHLAHTSWFFETFLLRPHLPGYRVFHPRYAYLFNSYYETIGSFYPRERRGLLSRPNVDETLAYRQHVDAAMMRLMAAADSETLATLTPLLTLGLQHEQQHQELLVTDIKHILAQNPLRPVYRQQHQGPAVATPALQWLEFSGGLQRIGHSGDGFAFDNETPAHTQYVPPFRLASKPVSNGEYLAFIDDGGYRRPEHWLSDGWRAVGREGWNAPLYWFQENGDWWQFTLSGARMIDPDEPVCHLSYYEADAFARWAGRRLPTESEWEVAARDQPCEGHFADSGRLHPKPASGDGPQQFFGDVWEWTQSPYTAYPGYRPVSGAIGEYNGKFMCNQMVLRGGSCATPPGHIRPSYRNFFPPDARWQFTGLRLAEDL
ncbi:ergothioneine biosynthesis protein EgtB [Thermithiobacillus plumbiphilus]|uniref:Ergothioneine biosynthesis protein EgtB n=1 Tax=Thermithiobacillus plumbiphilus TaxID=1729899 RepID=A0ABU9DAL8_9PROT